MNAELSVDRRLDTELLEGLEGKHPGLEGYIGPHRTFFAYNSLENQRQVESDILFCRDHPHIPAAMALKSLEDYDPKNKLQANVIAAAYQFVESNAPGLYIQSDDAEQRTHLAIGLWKALCDDDIPNFVQFPERRQYNPDRQPSPRLWVLDNVDTSDVRAKDYLIGAIVKSTPTNNRKIVVTSPLPYDKFLDNVTEVPITRSFFDIFTKAHME